MLRPEYANWKLRTAAQARGTPWEVGKPPDFVLEVGSESTAENDLIGKRRTYAQIGRRVLSGPVLSIPPRTHKNAPWPGVPRMTTKLAYHIQTEIDYDSLSFNL